MRLRDDYRIRMTLSQFTDEDLDLLIQGEPRSADLERLVPFVAALRAQADNRLGPGLTELTAMRAAAIARSHASTERSVSQLRQSRPSAWRRLRAQSTVALGSVVVVAALSGVGLAADAASPGDFLYGIDMALEEIGIGSGSIAERLEEAGVLVERDDISGAVDLLADSISQADPDGNAAALAAAIQALEELSSDLDAGAEPASDALEKVSDLLDFIDANAGKGNGLDGTAFGQGVAEIAKGGTPDGDESEAVDPGSDPTDAPGNSENSNAGGSGDGDINDASGEPPGNTGDPSSGEEGGSTEPPGNSGSSNAGGDGNGNNGSGEPPGNPGNSNAGGNGSGKP